MRDYRLVEGSTLCPPWCLSLSATGLLRIEEPVFLRKLLTKVLLNVVIIILFAMLQLDSFLNLFAVISLHTHLFVFVFVLVVLMLCVQSVTSKEKLATDSC